MHFWVISSSFRHKTNPLISKEIRVVLTKLSLRNSLVLVILVILSIIYKYVFSTPLWNIPSFSGKLFIKYSETFYKIAKEKSPGDIRWQFIIYMQVIFCSLCSKLCIWVFYEIPEGSTPSKGEAALLMKITQ